MLMAKKAYFCTAKNGQRNMADKGTKKTNAARLLDQLKVHYELIPYEVDESDLGGGADGSVDIVKHGCKDTHISRPDKNIFCRHAEFSYFCSRYTITSTQ